MLATRGMAVLLALALVAGCSSNSDVPVSEAGAAGTGGTGGTATGGSAGADPEGGASGSNPAGGSADAATETGSACVPTLAGWMPKWIPPGPPYSGVCTAAQIDSVAIACFDGLAATPCPPSNPDACATCLASRDIDSQYGPYVRFTAPAVVQQNIGGCVAALSGDTSSTGCGAKVEAIAICEIEACKHCSDLGGFNTCHTAAGADPNTCKPYWDASVACVAMLDPAVRASCYGSGNQTPLVIARRLGVIFCGDAPNDAGSGDSGLDAASD